MIHLIHDGVTSTCAEDEGRTLGDVLQDRLFEVGAIRRVITRLRLDDREVESERIESTLGGPFRGFAVAEIESQPVEELVREGLQVARDHVASVSDALEQTATLLRAGRMPEAQGLFADTLEALHVLVFGLAALAHELGAAGEGLRAQVASLKPWLEALSEAQATQDWLRLADCLEHEIGPRVRQWQDHLDALDAA